MTNKQALLARPLAAVVAVMLAGGVAHAQERSELQQMRDQIQALAAEMQAMRQQQSVLEQRLAQSESAREALQVQASAPAPVQSAGATPAPQTAPQRSATAEAVRLPSPPVPAPRDSLTQPGRGVAFVIPGTETTLRFTGLVKIDAYSDLSGAGLNTIPTDGVSIPIDGTSQARRTGHFLASARQSRFGFTSETPTRMGPLRSQIELDFYGTGGTALITNPVSPRLRHAWMSLGDVLVGQTWSVFYDLEVAPETLDMTGAVGTTYAIRQPLIRYQHRLSPSATLALGIENPEGDFLGADHTNNFPVGSTMSTRVLNQIPDFTARFTYRTGPLRVSAAGVARFINLDTGGASLPFVGPNGSFTFAGSASTWAFGAQLNAQVRTSQRDTLMVGIAGGPGIGRYLMAPQDAAFAIGLAPNGMPNANPGNGAILGQDGRLRSIFTWGAVASYRHYWTPNLRSNLTVGYQDGDNPDGTLPINFQDRLTTVHANLIWSPLPQLAFGIEYVRGTMELFGQTAANRALGYGDDGEVNRLQISAQYNLF